MENVRLGEAMPLINSGIWLWKHAVARYSSNQLADEIETLHKRISDLYSDIATAHFLAAKDAVLAVDHSTHPQMEIRAAISHMTEAFRILEEAAGKKVKKHFLLFFDYDEYIIPDREAIQQCLAHWAALIAIMYASLGEPENSKKWKQIAIDFFSKYIEFIQFTPEELQKLNKGYVRVVQVRAYHPAQSDFDIGHYETEDELKISARGTKYIKRWKDNAKKEFISRIDSITFCFD